MSITCENVGVARVKQSVPYSIHFLIFISRKMIWTFITILFSCSLSLLHSQLKTDTCGTYNHPQHGSGQCIDQSQCPNSFYVSGLCESHPSSIQCCFSLNDPIIEEFRAVWIATVDNIDWPSSNTAPPAQQQSELIQILDTVQTIKYECCHFSCNTKEIDVCFQ